MNIDSLFDSLYSELRRLAGNVLSEQRRGHTLQPTALINEIWIKLAGHQESIQDRTHFLALAARAMRQVLTDHARRNRSEKRGGNASKLTFSEGTLSDHNETLDLIDFHDSLELLSSLNERQAKVAELRLLGTLTIHEIADLLEISERTAKRDWRLARLWILNEIKGA
jgi:RNA polymerase sigma factor (TIGR02999 family)